jgi:hypothetical protein
MSKNTLTGTISIVQLHKFNLLIMDSENKEINSILAIQKKQVDKLEEQKEVLLLETGQNDVHRELKHVLGWDEVDSNLEKALRKTIEAFTLSKKFEGTEVVSEETLMIYCLKNNYVIVNLSEYKGYLHKDMLDAIAEHLKQNSLNLQSESNVQTLKILCPFTEVNNKVSENAKRSVRYNPAKASKVLLLEKIDPRSTVNVHYKVLSEYGKVDRVKNFINSIFLTHPRTANFAMTATLFSLVTMVFFIIRFIIQASEDVFNPIDWTNALIASSLVLFVKACLPIWFDSCDDGSINWDKDVINMNLNSARSAHVNSARAFSSLVRMHFSKELFKSLDSRTLVTFKSFMSRVIMVVVYAALFIALFRLSTVINIVTFQKNQTYQEWTDASKKTYNIYKYKATSPFTYKRVLIDTKTTY